MQKTELKNLHFFNQMSLEYKATKLQQDYMERKESQARLIEVFKQNLESGNHKIGKGSNYVVLCHCVITLYISNSMKTIIHELMVLMKYDQFQNIKKHFVCNITEFKL